MYLDTPKTTVGISPDEKGYNPSYGRRYNEHLPMVRKPPLYYSYLYRIVFFYH
nr:MAG TPA: hypothetical protein [Bacteriophage sp.]